ncbi:sigma factor-like helix-turn-helix DNA-binding protein [Sphingosinicella sp.]|uniref:sigma factor-like helix-turn-helix DNA-binding protein n=1 Tax=Sphingosinicella sp. TaxID=1917971 RepID=UPI0035B19C71
MNGESVPEPGVPLERDRHAVMRAWLRKLPERTLVVFIAHRVEGKSYAEIARELGIGEWRVRWHMRKAIRHILKIGKPYREAFAALDPVSQQVMELAWDGLLNDRIALRLGLSVTEVETRMAAALVALHKAATL